MSLFHRVWQLFTNLALIYIYGTKLDLSRNSSSLIGWKTITKINFWYGMFRQGKTINVWAYISIDVIANFNFLAPNSAKM